MPSISRWVVNWQLDTSSASSFSSYRLQFLIILPLQSLLLTSYFHQQARAFLGLKSLWCVTFEDVAVYSVLGKSMAGKTVDSFVSRLHSFYRPVSFGWPPVRREEKTRKDLLHVYQRRRNKVLKIAWNQSWICICWGPKMKFETLFCERICVKNNYINSFGVAPLATNLLAGIIWLKKTCKKIKKSIIHWYHTSEVYYTSVFTRDFIIY